MGVAWRYTPPRVNALPIVHAAAEVAVHQAAETILDASRDLVPVDTGALRDSGRVSQDGLEATISYGAEDGAGRDGQDTAAYAVPQHERMDFTHPNGQAKFLEVPLHANAERAAEIIAAELRRALQ